MLFLMGQMPLILPGCEKTGFDFLEVMGGRLFSEYQGSIFGL